MKHSVLEPLRDSKGQSLVQVLITAAIGVVVLLLIASIQTNQNRENVSLSEKMASNDFQQQVLRAFSDGSVCTKLLTTPTPLTFDSTHAVTGDPNPPTLNLPISVTTIPVSTDAGAPPLATVGSPVSGLATNVIVGGANPFQITGLVGTNNGTTGSYTGFFAINYDNTKIIRTIHGAGVQVLLKTTTSGTTQTIVSCASAAATNCWVQGPSGLTETTCGNVGIGTMSPYAPVNIRGTIASTTNSTGDLAGLIVEADGNWGGGVASKVTGITTPNNLGPRFVGYAARGPMSAPAALQTGDVILTLVGVGHNGATWSTTGNGSAFVSMEADGNFTPTSTPTRLTFYTNPTTTSSASAERMRIDSNGYVGIGTPTPSRRFTVSELNVPAVIRVETGNTAATAADVEFSRVGSGHQWTLSQWNDNTFQLILDSGLPGGFSAWTSDLAGNLSVRGSLTAAGSPVVSDARLKTQVVPLAGALDKALALQGVSYVWAEPSRAQQQPGPQIGFLAQQVQAVVPEVVKEVANADATSSLRRILTVDYSRLTPILLEAFKEFYRRWVSENASVQAELARLRQENLVMKNYLCGKDANAPMCHDLAN